MSKKIQIKEHKNYNKLCENCYHQCKQYDTVKLVSCPNYKYKPYQLYLPFWKQKRWLKKTKTA